MPLFIKELVKSETLVVLCEWLFRGYFIDPLTMLLLGENAIALQPQLWLIDALEWVKGLGVSGAIAFILLYILATIFFLPGFILTLGAGVLYGVAEGALYVWIGATLGGTCAFLIGRYLARGWVTQRIANYPQFTAIDAAVSQAAGLVLEPRVSYGDLVNVVPANPVAASRGWLRVTPGDPDESFLYVKLVSASGALGGRMPLGQAPLPADQIELVRAWILAGAPLGTASRARDRTVGVQQ